jgi:putative spermidine/putrescine transport system ATP-binding protein
VAVFDKGVVQQLDSVDRLYESPCNEFVANFIGDSNRLCGTIDDVDGNFCRLRLRDGTHVVGRNIGEARAGTPAVACIRPERLRLGEAAGHAGANTLASEVRGLIYFGDHVRMRCAVPEQDECLVKVPLGTEVLERFAPGAHVALSFAPEHLRVFA